MSDHHPDLFDWSPALENPPLDVPGGAPAGAPLILVFPADRRIGKIRDVASKLMAKTTERAVAHYRRQVTEALEGNLQCKRVPSDQHPEQIRKFWLAVDCEVARRLNSHRRPGGTA